MDQASTLKSDNSQIFTWAIVVKLLVYQSHKQYIVSTLSQGKYHFCLIASVGFGAGGVVAGSLASVGQSMIYGAYTGGIFSTLQSAGMYHISFVITPIYPYKLFRGGTNTRPGHVR